jgi:hypothetical protein
MKASMSFLVTPIIFLLHILEEWPRFPEWATRHFGTTSRAWFVYTHIVLVSVVTGICWMATFESSRTWIILAFATQWGLQTNAVFHLVTWRLFKEYSPGLVTALILFVPATAWQVLTLEIDLSDFATAVALGSLAGGAAISSLWFNADIGWNLRRTPAERAAEPIA